MSSFYSQTNLIGPGGTETTVICIAREGKSWISIYTGACGLHADIDAARARKLAADLIALAEETQASEQQAKEVQP